MKEIQALLNGKSMIGNFKGFEKCEGCQEEIELVEYPIIGGPNKGQPAIFRKGCKCEERKLAKEALEARERAKKQYALDLFDSKSLINEDLKKATLKNYMPKNQTHQNALEWAVDYCKSFNTRENKKAILAGSGARLRINPDVAVPFLTRGLVNFGEQTFFAGVEQFPAASYVVLDLKRVNELDNTGARVIQQNAPSTPASHHFSRRAAKMLPKARARNRLSL